MFAGDPTFAVVGEAGNGTEAIELVSAERPDVVLMDLRMPGMGGVEAIRQLRQTAPTVRVLVLATYDTDEDVLPAIEAGAIGYLLKDAPREELVRAVRAAFQGDAVLSPSVARRLIGQVRKPTLLRRFLVNWTLATEAQGVSLGGRTLRRDDLVAVDVGRPSLGANVATLLAPLFAEDASEVMAVLEEFYGFLADDRAGPAFLFSPWPTPDLRPHGWDLVDYQPLMLHPAGGSARPIPAGLRLEEVRDEKSLLAFEATMLRGFQMDELEGLGPGAVFGASILVDEQQRLWVGWEEDRLVSAAATFVAEGINGVTLVATVPEARGHGYGSALTWQATNRPGQAAETLTIGLEPHFHTTKMCSFPLHRTLLASRSLMPAHPL